ncbi:hypothetical protein IV203_036145 [Nitzschia inconspicua]|uniref:BZIP domain-containing protein n=1 Tax=Nitzschia inconspicua TaxID=303405 RepID=A0A9K3PVA3_9STRA|nr:hypothetical protein IV203_036145 [Nitzschia inconspicua]
MNDQHTYQPQPPAYQGLNTTNIPGGEVGYHHNTHHHPPPQHYQTATIAEYSNNTHGDTQQYLYNQHEQPLDPGPDGNNTDIIFANGDSLSMQHGLVANGGGGSGCGGGASNLDHALLESLFYNEMALLDASSGNSDDNSDFIAHHFAVATNERITPPPPSSTSIHSDPTVFVEKEILRDFGVGTPQRESSRAMDGSVGQTTTATTTYLTEPNPPPTHWQGQQQPTHVVVTHTHQPHLNPQHLAPSHTQPYQQQQPHQHQPYHPPQQYVHVPPPGASSPPVYYYPPQYPPPPLAQAPPGAPAAASSYARIQPDTQHGSVTVASHAHAPPMLHPPATNTNQQQQQHPFPNGSPEPALQTEPPVPISVSNPQIVVPRDKARQLVDQFATLASRLGIDLPDTVLQSLTTAAARNDPSLVQTKEQQQTRTGPTNNKEEEEEQELSNSAQDENSRNGNTKMDVVVAPTLAELRKTAEEAIAAVTRKRSWEHQDSIGSNDNQGGDDSKSDEGGNNGSANSISGKPTYSKRRKKPRLAECESRLARLQAENEQLKRHLENVSNKAHKFNQEKEEAGKRIAQLIHENAGPEAMAVAVRKFSDMYSDYGVNRQQELTFHLEQLQRLVNPTNFTKMGLWTMGQNNHDPKKNPIAGILVKELTITPAQGKKILDQSEKIRKLCDNLRETHALLVKLKTLCEKKKQIFQDRMSKCTEILTSQQVVKLICWINEHSELLGTICPGWGTEQIISSKKPSPP